MVRERDGGVVREVIDSLHNSGLLIGLCQLWSISA